MKKIAFICSLCLALSAVNLFMPAATQTANAVSYVSAANVSAYAYENQAAAITIASKSDDTLSSPDFSIAGSVNKTGSIVLYINGQNASAQNIFSANGAFSFTGVLKSGRNDINLLFTDNAGNITRKSFNFVYLKKSDVTVDCNYRGADGATQDGVKTFRTLQAAVNSLSSSSTSRIIYVKNGNYNERVVVKSSNISIIGQDSQKTRIFYSIASKDVSSMTERNCMKIEKTAENFTLENITVENSYPYSNGSNEQADALCVLADCAIFTNVRLIGYQDTLLTDSSSSSVIARQYFSKCYITGNVDFIYGRARSYFEDCDIVGRYTPYKSDGCFMAPRTDISNAYGYVFNQCRFYAENGIGNGKYRLARPWGADASATFLNCYMGPCVLSTAYGDMSGNSYKAARFAEYASYGSGAAVNGDRPQLSASQAANLNASKVFAIGTSGSFDYASIMRTMYGAAEEIIETTTSQTTAAPPPISEEYTHNFSVDAASSPYFTILGAISYDKGTMSYNNLVLNDCLKLDSKGSLSFTLSAPSQITLVLKSKIANGVMYLNGASVSELSDISTSGNVRTLLLNPGTYTLSKGVGETYIYYVSISGKTQTTTSPTTTSFTTTSSTTLFYTETTKTTETLYGDINLDGFVTGNDVILFMQHFLGKNVLIGQALLNADVQLDGEISVTDLATLKQYCMGDNVTLG